MATVCHESPGIPLSSRQYALARNLRPEYSVKSMFHYATETIEEANRVCTCKETLSGPTSDSDTVTGIVSAAVFSVSSRVFAIRSIIESKPYEKWLEIRHHIIQCEGVKKFFIEDGILRFFVCPIAVSAKDVGVTIPLIPVRAGDGRTYDLLRLQEWRKSNLNQPYPESTLNPPRNPKDPFELSFDFPFINTIVERIHNLSSHILHINLGAGNHTAGFNPTIHAIILDYLVGKSATHLFCACNEMMNDRIAIRKNAYEKAAQDFRQQFTQIDDKIRKAKEKQKQAQEKAGMIKAAQSAYAKFVASAPNNSVTSLIKSFAGDIFEDLYDRIDACQKTINLQLETTSKLTIERIIRAYLGNDQDERLEMIQSVFTSSLQYEQERTEKQLRLLEENKFNHQTMENRLLLERQDIISQNLEFCRRVKIRLRVEILDSRIVRWFKDLFGVRPNFKFVEQTDENIDLAQWPNRP